MSALPALFLSHGAPTLPLEDRPASRFLAALGREFCGALGAPRAIVIISAHYETQGAEVSLAARPQTIHDFRGFPVALNAMRHPAAGDPALAQDVAERLRRAGIAVRTHPSRGLDHGAWTPLVLIDPDAAIPVVSLSISPGHDAAWHFAMGRALAPLRDDGVLIIGSGAATHNLSAFFSGGFAIDDEAPVARDFADALARALEGGDWDAVLRGPDGLDGGRFNHPSDDHITPLYVAMGAGGPGAGARRIHASTNYGVIAMDAYAFGGPETAALAL
jgi:4,5-DOPA dioxygenase extradiol